MAVQGGFQRDAHRGLWQGRLDWLCHMALGSRGGRADDGGRIMQKLVLGLAVVVIT
jgi:hypothetical protein